MYGSTTESDACGNDWDDTWTPQQDASLQMKNFIWRRLWKKFHIQVHYLDGTTTDHMSECLVPCKMQFFIQHNVERLQKVIRAIRTFDVESINSSNELLEIKIKSQFQDDVYSQIETAISNECEDIIMKTVLKYTFTERLLEEICLQQLASGNIYLLSDDAKVCIVGFSEMKDDINKALNEIDRATVKRNIQWKEKWKMAAAIKFGLIETLSTTFGNDLIISVQQEKCSVCIHGREVAVEKAQRELDTLLSALFVEKIEISRILVTLLAVPEAALLFTNIIESKRLPVIWVFEDENISFISKSQVDRYIIRSEIYENFHEVGFSDSLTNHRDFVASNAFIDFVNVYNNKLLITEKTSTGVILVSTRGIIQELLHMEKLIYLNSDNTKGIQVNIQDTRYIRLEEDYMTLKKNLMAIEVKLKNETTIRIDAEKTLQQYKEKYKRTKQFCKEFEDKFKDEQTNLKQQIEQLTYKCIQESDEKKNIECELLRTRERLAKVEKDFQRLKQCYKELEEKIKGEQLDWKQQIEQQEYKLKEENDEKEQKESDSLKIIDRLKNMGKDYLSYNKFCNDIKTSMNSPKSELYEDVQNMSERNHIPRRFGSENTHDKDKNMHDENALFGTEDAVRIVLIGRTGNGKSATGNSIMKQKNFFHSCLSVDSVTQVCQRGEVVREGKKVVVVDSPGFFDTKRHSDITRTEVIKCISLSSPGPHAILFVLSCRSRCTVEEEVTLAEMITIFGEDLYKYVIFIFTAFDDIQCENRKFEEVLDNYKDRLKTVFQKCGNRVLAFNNRVASDDAENERQLQSLFAMITNMNGGNSKLYYQNEMLKNAEHVIEQQMKKIIDEKIKTGEKIDDLGLIREIVRSQIRDDILRERSMFQSIKQFLFGWKAV